MVTRNKGLRGRAAAHNPANRYGQIAQDPLDDGWDTPPPARVKTRIEVDHARSAITYNQSPDIRFERSVNPYRGCEHGCIYCYARPTHAWLDLSPGLDFETRLFARPGLPDRLRAELAAPGYRVATVAIGTITDAYQPHERHAGITRRVLAQLAKCRHPAMVITKSALVERDVDLLADMAADDLVEVAVSLTTLTPDLARDLEPRAAAPARRLRTVALLAAAGIPVRVLIAPVIPVLNDHEIEDLLTAAAEAGARAAAYVALRLPLEVAPLFRDWLHRHRPDAAGHVMARIREMRAGHDNDPRFHSRMTGGGAYADMLGQRFQLAARRNGLATDERHLRHDLFRPPAAPAPQGDQLDLFRA